jgi:hypothetical protein
MIREEGSAWVDGDSESEWRVTLTLTDLLLEDIGRMSFWNCW